MAVESKQGGANVRFPPPLVFVAAIGLGLLLHFFVLPVRSAYVPWVRLLVGVPAILAGLFVILGAVGLFRKTGQDPKPWEPTPELIFDGPYRYTRNPMYVGMTAITIGIGVCANVFWIPLLAVPALAIVHAIAVRPEEAYLKAKFGAPYEEYARRVRRYL